MHSPVAEELRWEQSQLLCLSHQCLSPLEISQQIWVWLLHLTGIPFHDIPILHPSTVHELTHMNSL